MDTDRDYTAWELAADGAWMDDGAYLAVVVGGRVQWESVDPVKAGDGKTVRLSRLAVLPGMKLREARRYVDPDTKMRLVPFTRES